VASNEVFNSGPPEYEVLCSVSLIPEDYGERCAEDVSSETQCYILKAKDIADSSIGSTGPVCAHTVECGVAPYWEDGNLTTELTASPEPVPAGDNLTYTYSYANNGTSDLTNLTIVDTLPEGTTFVSATGGGAYDEVENQVTWSLGTLIPNGEGSVEMVVQVDGGIQEGTEIQNTYNISSDQSLCTESTPTVTSTVSSGSALFKGNSSDDNPFFLAMGPGNILPLRGYSSNHFASPTTLTYKGYKESLAWNRISMPTLKLSDKDLIANSIENINLKIGKIHKTKFGRNSFHNGEEDNVPSALILETSSISSTETQLASHRLVGTGDPDVAYQVTFYHLDHLGTPRILTNHDGSIQSRHHYLPFGEEVPFNPSTNSRQFTGHERDIETGLDYMLARYYGPKNIFRFMAPDPGNDTNLRNPQTWNKYTYVRNNPLILIDPDGKKFRFAKDKGYKKAVKKELKKLKKSDPRMKKAIKKMKKSDKVITFKPTSSDINEGMPGVVPTDPTADPQTTPTDSTVHFDPNQTVKTGEGLIGPTEVLGHELSHAEDNTTGTADYSGHPENFTVPSDEVKAVRMQNLYRNSQGQGPRTGYGEYSDPNSPLDKAVFAVPCPTCAPGDPWE
jgi:RHS repeat-associated protein/uncharacterized repeat protein (TIGR01451 family)